jgi:hypothetical protein
MSTLRYAFPISYVFFVVLLAGTLVLFDPFDLSENWVLALVVPALVTALITFVIQPLYEWLRLSPSEKSLIRARHVSYYIILAIVMLFAPIALACPMMNVPEPVSFGVLILTLLLLTVNTTMLLFAGYFVGEVAEV